MPTSFLFNFILSNLMDKNGKKGLKRTRFQRKIFLYRKEVHDRRGDVLKSETLGPSAEQGILYSI